MKPPRANYLTLVAMILLCFGCSRDSTKLLQPSSNEKNTALELGITFARIPAGSFLMGSTSVESDKYEKPVHRVVFVKVFEMQTTEVTQAQWEAVMGSNPSYYKGDSLPVEQVSWDDCQAFIQKLNTKYPGKNYRLPTEAEWEYACRAGTTDDRYGNLDDIAWYRNNNSSSTHAVGTKMPNNWGLFDMLGNVHEWCRDSWHINYQGAPTDGSAWIIGEKDEKRVFRGGGLNFDVSYLRASSRAWETKDSRYGFLGFRLVRDAVSENPEDRLTVIPNITSQKSVECVNLKFGDVKIGNNISHVMTIVDRSVVATANVEEQNSALLCPIQNLADQMRFALNGKQYELFFSRAQSPWTLEKIIEKPFAADDFPEKTLIKKSAMRISQTVKFAGVRIYQDPQGSSYGGWSTEVSISVKNVGRYSVNSVPYALIAYDSAGTPDLARFGPGAGKYSAWGVISGELAPGQVKTTEKIDIGVLYRKPQKIKVIFIDEALSEGQNANFN